jgi:hypothetical protein
MSTGYLIPIESRRRPISGFDLCAKLPEGAGRERNADKDTLVANTKEVGKLNVTENVNV